MVTQPMEGETMEQWVMRETKPLRNPDWRCPHCEYGVSLDGKDDVRTKWCGDSWEERMMDAAEDLQSQIGRMRAGSALRIRPEKIIFGALNAIVG